MGAEVASTRVMLSTKAQLPLATPTPQQQALVSKQLEPDSPPSADPSLGSQDRSSFSLIDETPPHSSRGSYQRVSPYSPAAPRNTPATPTSASAAPKGKALTQQQAQSSTGASKQKGLMSNILGKPGPAEQSGLPLPPPSQPVSSSSSSIKPEGSNGRHPQDAAARRAGKAQKQGKSSWWGSRMCHALGSAIRSNPCISPSVSVPPDHHPGSGSPAATSYTVLPPAPAIARPSPAAAQVPAGSTPAVHLLPVVQVPGGSEVQLPPDVTAADIYSGGTIPAAVAEVATAEADEAPVPAAVQAVLGTTIPGEPAHRVPSDLGRHGMAEAEAQQVPTAGRVQPEHPGLVATANAPVTAAAETGSATMGFQPGATPGQSAATGIVESTKQPTATAAVALVNTANAPPGGRAALQPAAHPAGNPSTSGAPAVALSPPGASVDAPLDTSPQPVSAQQVPSSPPPAQVQGGTGSAIKAGEVPLATRAPVVVGPSAGPTSLGSATGLPAVTASPALHSVRTTAPSAVSTTSAAEAPAGPASAGAAITKEDSTPAFSVSVEDTITMATAAPATAAGAAGGPGWQPAPAPRTTTATQAPATAGGPSSGPAQQRAHPETVPVRGIQPPPSPCPSAPPPLQALREPARLQLPSLQAEQHHQGGEQPTRPARPVPALLADLLARSQQERGVGGGGKEVPAASGLEEEAVEVEQSAGEDVDYDADDEWWDARSVGSTASWAGLSEDSASGTGSTVAGALAPTATGQRGLIEDARSAVAASDVMPRMPLTVPAPGGAVSLPRTMQAQQNQLNASRAAALPGRTSEADIGAFSPGPPLPTGATSSATASPAVSARAPTAVHLEGPAVAAAAPSGLPAPSPSPLASPFPVHAHTRSASAQLVARHLTPHPSTGTALVLPLEGGPGVRVPIADVMSEHSPLSSVTSLHAQPSGHSWSSRGGSGACPGPGAAGGSGIVASTVGGRTGSGGGGALSATGGGCSTTHTVRAARDCPIPSAAPPVSEKSSRGGAGGHAALATGDCEGEVATPGIAVQKLPAAAVQPTSATTAPGLRAAEMGGVHASAVPVDCEPPAKRQRESSTHHTAFFKHLPDPIQAATAAPAQALQKDPSASRDERRLPSSGAGTTPSAGAVELSQRPAAVHQQHISIPPCTDLAPSGPNDMDLSPIKAVPPAFAAMPPGAAVASHPGPAAGVPLPTLAAATPSTSTLTSTAAAPATEPSTSTSPGGPPAAATLSTSTIATPFTALPTPAPTSPAVPPAAGTSAATPPSPATAWDRGVDPPPPDWPPTSPAALAAQTGAGGHNHHHHHHSRGHHGCNGSQGCDTGPHQEAGKGPGAHAATPSDSKPASKLASPAGSGTWSSWLGGGAKSAGGIAAVHPHPSVPPGELGVLPPWVPKKPPRFVNPDTCWVPFPRHTGFEGYWEKIPELSSKLPMPIDVLLDVSWLAKKAHESIKGIKVDETARDVTIQAKVTLYAATIVHKETYAKDGSSSLGLMRRDVRPGTITFKAYYTDRSEMVLIVETFSLTGRLEHSGVEVCTVLAPGQQVRFMQACHDHNTGRSAVQEFVGRRAPSPY